MKLETLKKQAKISGALLAITAISISLWAVPAQAESLFRATANYRDSVPYTPPSLFTAPIPKNVGDMITILVNDKSQLATTAELKVARAQTVDSNGSGMFNSMIRFFTDKLPFGSSVSKVIAAPSFNGLDSTNNMNSKAESTRDTQLTDTITCQVVQILPNGFLMVQGKKTTAVNRDQQEIYVSGIVNPYFLDRNNQIASTQVGNFQLMQGGKGVVSRTQSDGIANKVYQFFQ